MLASSFCSYIGFFDHHYRKILFDSWKKYLKEDAGILFREDISLIEYLSLPSEKLIWEANGLPPDDLCISNAILLKRSHRYPLIIDPSEYALKFLKSFYKNT